MTPAERTRQWRLDNPERAREADRRKREKKPELYRAIYKRHYDANSGKICDAAREYRKANPEKRRTSARPSVERYQARRRGAATAEKFDRAAIYERDDGRCHLCGRFVARNDFTLDHLTPLSLGGSHTARNVKVAHRSCNSRKGARFISQ